MVEKKKNLYVQNFDGEANWSDVVNFPCNVKKSSDELVCYTAVFSDAKNGCVVDW